jgi:hypothetical protein
MGIPIYEIQRSAFTIGPLPVDDSALFLISRKGTSFSATVRCGTRLFSVKNVSDPHFDGT